MSEKIESMYAILAVLKHRESRVHDVERKTQIQQQIASMIFSIVEEEEKAKSQGEI